MGKKNVCKGGLLTASLTGSKEKAHAAVPDGFTALTVRFSSLIEFLQPVAVQQRGDLFCRDRPADEVPLHDLAAESAQRCELCLRLHPFGDGAEIQSPGSGPRIELMSASLTGECVDVLDEVAVDFQDVEREALQVGQRRITRCRSRRPPR